MTPAELHRERRKCPKCGSYNMVYNGTTVQGQQKYYCKDCRRYGSLDLVRTRRRRQDEDNVK